MAIAFVRQIPASGTLGASASTITTAYNATGVDCVIGGFVAGGTVENMSATTITAKTYAGVTLTTILGPSVQAGSSTGTMAMLGLLLPTTGTNNFIITISTTGGGMNISPIFAGYSGVDSFGNTGFNNPAGNTGNSPSCNVTVATGNVGVCIAAHGDTISGAGTGCTQRALNNYSSSYAGGCVAIVDRAGAGGTAAMNVNSSISDHWNMMAVELVAAAAGGVSDYPRARRNLGLLIR